MKNTKLWRGLFAVVTLLLALIVFLTALLMKWEGQVNAALGLSAPAAEGSGASTYASDYDSSDEELEASEENDVQTMREGAVLVKNDGNALPLAESERSVTLFGRAAADPVYRGNSGGPSSSGNVSLYDALTDEGFSVNGTVFDALAASSVTRVKVAVENTAGNRSDIGEVPVSFYDGYASTYPDYSDAAIVVLARDGGEGFDLFQEDIDGISQLALHDDEADLLRMIRDSGVFGKTVVLLNSPYAMELGFLEEEEYGVDACLWVGQPGSVGFEGVADLLVGNADPSGHFVDTYAADSLSSAAVQNAGDFSFADSSGVNYIAEAEGIYVGYRYYETRYYDQVLGLHNAKSSSGTFASSGNWDYAEEIAYPYGYGTSYSSFTQTLKGVEWDTGSHEVSVTVNVRNDGNSASSYSGESKTAVQLYVSLPWESGQAEKSAIQLIDFEKSSALAVGEDEDITLTVSDYLFATYDESAENGADATQEGCYVFDAGDYYFSVGDNAHDALNNVLAAQGASGMTDHEGAAAEGDASMTAKITLASYDNSSYAVSAETGEVVCNRFQDVVDVNNLSGSDVVTYLTRADWTTFPETYDSLSMSDEMEEQYDSYDFDVPDDAPEYGDITTGADVTVTFPEMYAYAYEDGEWETFLDQLSISDMCSMVGENFGQNAITGIVKPTNMNTDGPAGPQYSTMVHINEVVTASAFSKELIANRGDFIGEECLYTGTTQLWAPGCNIHRTPFSGRNFEYYSEDSVMSYICSAVQCEAMQAKGCNAAPKHFMGNDQETNRGGLCIFWTEQGLRQGPMKGFEGAFREGGALGTMLSCSRVGCVQSYMCPELLTQVLRNEWGFQGVTITDSVANWSSSSDAQSMTVKALVSGSDTFNANTGCGTNVKKYVVANKDGYVLSCLREANRHFFFAMSRSSLINGLTADTVVTEWTPWWQTALTAIEVAAIAADCVLFVLLCVSEALSRVGKNGKRGEKS